MFKSMYSYSERTKAIWNVPTHWLGNQAFDVIPLQTNYTYIYNNNDYYYMERQT